MRRFAPLLPVLLAAAPACSGVEADRAHGSRDAVDADADAGDGAAKAGDATGHVSDAGAPDVGDAGVGEPDDLDAFLLDEMERLHLPGLAFAVVIDGATVRAGGLGWADVDLQLPATADTPFLVASVSKTVTAVALLQVYETGAFDLDDELRRHRPLHLHRGHEEGGRSGVPHRLWGRDRQDGPRVDRGPAAGRRAAQRQRRVSAEPARPILMAIDGEPHTDAAVEWALDLARRLEVPLVAVHVKDPYLEQFQGELYAQGREEYVEHVGRCLAEEAEGASARFMERARLAGVDASVRVRRGDPADELLDEASDARWGLLVVGSKRLRGLAAWRSRNLPGKLAAATCPVPVLIVPQDGWRYGPASR